MAYIDVISLATAKHHLRIQDTTFDAEITRMINSALSFIDKYTNVVAFAQDKSYWSDEAGCVKVYDYPINSVTSPIDGVESKRKATFSNYTLDAETELVLNIGFADPLDYPPELIDAALQMIDVWFYGGEKQVNMRLIPKSVFDVLNTHKRFIL